MTRPAQGDPVLVDVTVFMMRPYEEAQETVAATVLCVGGNRVIVKTERTGFHHNVPLEAIHG